MGQAEAQSILSRTFMLRAFSVFWGLGELSYE
jgi:hypothetical protein